MPGEVRARLVRQERIERLAVLREVDALREHMPHAELIGVEDALLVPHRQSALKPARRVQHEVRAGEQRRLHRVRGLLGSLGIGDFEAMS